MIRPLLLLALLAGCAAPCALPPSVVQLVAPAVSGSGVVVEGGIATACHVALHAPLAVWDAAGSFRGVAVNPRCAPGYTTNPSALTPDVARLDVRWDTAALPAARVAPEFFGAAVVDGSLQQGISGAPVMDSEGRVVGIVSGSAWNGRLAIIERASLPLTIHGYPLRACASLQATGVQR